MPRRFALLIGLALAVAACGGAADTTTTAASAETTTTAPTTTSTTEAAAEEDAADDAAGAVVFVAGDGTAARFEIAEVLRGEDVVVVGVNDAVAVGATTIDFDDPDRSEIGVVTIDAAAFVTDEDRRNNAIQRFILDVGGFPEITFTPTAFDGAAEALAGGSGTITGDLAIRDVTVPVTFDVTASEASPDGITAEARATVDRTDWDLNIPSVPFVASVAEEVVLVLELVLVPTG